MHTTYMTIPSPTPPQSTFIVHYGLHKHTHTIHGKLCRKGEEEKDDNYLPLSTQRGKREQDRKGTSIIGWDCIASATCSELWTKRCNWHLKAHGRRRWNQVIWCLHFWFQQVKEYCFSVHRKTFWVQTAWYIRMCTTGKCWRLCGCTVQNLSVQG